jgi:hypothetical protein
MVELIKDWQAQPLSTQKPWCFVSYSMREPTRSLLPVLIWHIFHEQYDVRLTPSALVSGQDQLSQIEAQIEKSLFGVVCLDGLRPNVVHEWGHLRGTHRPVIVIMREQATIDVLSLYGPSAPDGLSNPALDVDDHLSNLKGVNRATWYPDDPRRSVKIIWDEYNKMKDAASIDGLLEVREPRLW